MSESIVYVGNAVGAFGIYTRTEHHSDRPTLLLVNSGIVHRVGANRMSVTLARHVAAHGVAAFRFDMSGLGDARDRADGAPWEQSSAEEICDAIQCLCSVHGTSRVIVYGNCGGAAKSFWAAQREERIVGLALTNPPPHPRDDESGESPVLDDLRRLFDRGLRAIFIYADGDVGQAYFDRRLRESLQPYIDDARLTIAAIPRSNHTFAIAGARRMVLETITAWIDRHFAREG